MPKSQRIRTKVGVDKSVKVLLDQDFETLNILSLKILKSDIYNRQCSDYGVVVGRVSVNGGFGLPNAKVSIFIPLSEEDENDPVISELYPYKTLSDLDEDGYRYNLLAKEPSYDGHAATGTFPNREEVLTDQTYIEVYDKYYKFTTRTNDSGDYMIFGVPTGSQTIFMDVDLSDIGCFSLAPQDLIQAGQASESQVNGSKFKSSTNLNELPQVKTLNKIIEVSPLWGEPEICQLGITRTDFDLTAEANISINPTAVFMGSIFSTTEDDALRTTCKPKNNTGNLCELVSGPGQILSIRQTINNDDLGRPILEEFNLDNNGKVIDGDGAYLVNLPMNIDYVYTNEFGEQTISTDPTVGIPTKGKYRFKFKWENEGGLQNDTLRANYLVPNIKEYGWNTSDYEDDPLKNTLQQTLSFETSNLYTIGISNDSGIVFDDSVNVSSYSVTINGTPYYGDTQVIDLLNGDIVEIIPTLIDPNSPAAVTYTQYNKEYFDLLKSYSFSLDWDDYANPQSAIDCEDTFYEFNYNKVYTTAMFIDRYKNGLGRAKHLGIKEIDDRGCKSTVNTFPVNDIIRNFDFLFFVFNILINLLTIPILVLLFLAHFVAFLWPILKWVLIALGVYFVVQAAFMVYENISTAANITNEILGIYSPPFSFNITNALEAIRLFFLLIVMIVKTIFILGLSIAFLAITILMARRIKGFPRIGLPMISYPDCSTCDCQCGSAELADDFDENSITSDINQEGNSASSGSGLELPSGVPQQVSTQSSIFAPINSLGAYNVAHPNTDQDANSDNEYPANLGNFYFGGLNQQYRSFINQITSLQGGYPALGGTMPTPASLNFLRLAAGSESLDDDDPSAGIPSKYQLHAPTSFLFATYKSEFPNSFFPYGNGQSNNRYFAQPVTEAYSQKLNEFNYRKKYFDGVNKIEVTFNEPDNSGSSHFDQPLVILAKQGTLSNLGIGEVFSFQDPRLSNCNINLTGVTFTDGTNQFGENSLTGISESNVIRTVNYANPGNPANSLSTPYSLSNTGLTETQLEYPIDIEYFQVITGFTYDDFVNHPAFLNNNDDKFPNKYLHHKTIYTYAYPSNPNASGATLNPFQPPYLLIPDSLDTLNSYPTPLLTHKGLGVTAHTTSNDFQNSTTITNMFDYGNFEIIIMTRGVDPHSPKQKNKYDLSILLGQGSTNGLAIVEGDYYLNIPIQGFQDPINNNPNGDKPVSHRTGNLDNNTGNNLYFEPYNFRISETSNGVNEFSGFTSTLPFYYSNIDEQFGYTPYVNYAYINSTQIGASNTTGEILSSQRDRILPNVNIGPTLPFWPNNYTSNYYFAGGSYTSNNFSNTNTYFSTTTGIGLSNNTEKYYSPDWACCVGGVADETNKYYFVYSPAYHKYGFQPINFDLINQNNQLAPQYLVMRSDRIPTSTSVEDGPEFASGTNHTSYGLHQNNYFQVYKAGLVSAPQIGFAPDLNAGGESYDQTELEQSLTSTLSCENMVSLQCYQGNGTGITVNPNCEVTSNIVKNGCYCLLNPKPSDNKLFKKLYLINNAYKDDAKLFLEWKTRFVLLFAACRGVFAQTFQNNWINGALYMFSFSKASKFKIDNPTEPIYKYCKDTIVFNEITNSFFYRSSPWDGNNFIGVASPPTTGFPPYLVNDYPGTAYNDKRIQFPTTVMDLGPREKFISDICSSDGFNGYLVDQIRSTSYKDNSDIVQMGFLSRILNSTFRDQMLPIALPNGDDSEGKGLIQFFNSNRKGDRIDGDIAQALSINSEWRVTPYLNENYRDIDLFLGESTSPARPLFGIFFSSSTEEYTYRRKLTPGLEYSSLNCGGIYNNFGYPNDQVVPHYKWTISPAPDSSTFIFGTENNNWDTNYPPGNNGFYSNEYQNLNFDNIQEYFTTTTDLNFGFITNFDTNGNPVPQNYPPYTPQVTHGLPGQSVLVGAPFYFYFGLNNGKTAVDKFIKLYLETTS